MHAFGTESLDDTHTADGFLDDSREFGLLGLDGEYRRMNGSREAAPENLDERERREREQRQLPVGDQQNDRDGADHREIREGDGNHHDEHLDLVEVARGAAHQLTGLGSVVVSDVQRHDVAEESLAESGLGPPGFAERIEATERREEPCEQPGERDEAGPQPQHLIVTNAAVDAEPDENG